MILIVSPILIIGIFADSSLGPPMEFLIFIIEMLTKFGVMGLIIGLPVGLPIALWTQAQGYVAYQGAFIGGLVGMAIVTVVMLFLVDNIRADWEWALISILSIPAAVFYCYLWRSGLLKSLITTSE